MPLPVTTIEAMIEESRMKGFAEGFAEVFTEDFAKCFAESFGKRFAIDCMYRYYAEGEEEGRAEERADAIARERKMLRRFAKKRFDAKTAKRVAKVVRHIDEPEFLLDVADLIVECETDTELLARLRQGFLIEVGEPLSGH